MDELTAALRYLRTDRRIRAGEAGLLRDETGAVRLHIPPGSTVVDIPVDVRRTLIAQLDGFDSGDRTHSASASIAAVRRLLKTDEE